MGLNTIVDELLERRRSKDWVQTLGDLSQWLSHTGVPLLSRRVEDNGVDCPRTGLRIITFPESDVRLGPGAAVGNAALPTMCEA